MPSSDCKLKICIWSSASFEHWYSSYHLMLKIILEILEKGHEIWLVQQQYGNGTIPQELANKTGLHVVNIPQKEAEKQNFFLRYLRSIRYYIESSREIKKRSDFDVIFLQSNNVAIIPVTIARRLHIPVVYNVQDIFPIDAQIVGKISKWNPFFRVMKYLQAKAYKKASRVITISNDLKKTIQKEGRQDVDVIYNWSYQNTAYNITDENNHFLNANGMKGHDFFRVVYAGNIGQMIDIEMFIQCARRLSSKKDLKIFIIGEGSNLAKFKKRVKEENLNNILFFGRQPMEYAQDNYCAADVNINPVPRGVIYTCMPSKTATCLLSEKPTVVSMDLDSDMARRLSSVDQWTVIAPGDAEAMTNAILDIYNHGSRKSKNAVSFLQELCPMENAQAYVRILEEARVGF